MRLNERLNKHIYTLTINKPSDISKKKKKKKNIEREGNLVFRKCVTTTKHTINF